MAVSHPHTKFIVLILLISLLHFSKQSFPSRSNRLNDFLNRVLQPPEIPWVYSTSNLFSLAILEETVYNATRNNSKDLEFEEVSNWVNEYEATTRRRIEMLNIAKSDMRFNEIAHNIFLSLNMINRTLWFRKVLTTFNDPRMVAIQKADLGGIVKDFFSSYGLPNEEHLINILRRILVLQYVYDFPAVKLMEGIIGVQDTGAQLNIYQVYELAKFAKDSGLYPEALEWVDAIITKLKRSGNPGDNYNFAVSLLIAIAKEHDKSYGERKEWELQYKLEIPDFSGFYSNHYLGKILTGEAITTVKQIQLDKYTELDPNIGYIKLCRGESIRIRKEELYCKLETNDFHPNLILSPLKIEVLNLDPNIIQIYDVITESVNEFLANAEEKQEQSVILYRDEKETKNKRIIHPTRLSASSFIGNNLDSREKYFLKGIWNRIEHITNLSVVNSPNVYYVASENLQVTSYAAGGYFTPHWDQLLHKDKKDAASGERTATFMIYLNDVYGGYTVFPSVGVSVVPKRNSAIFWHNYHRNGTLDIRTFHGGCPVIHGSKWVVSVWIRSIANIFKRKCSINQYD